ncbi:MAG: hypothetical protein OEN56_11035 [Gemmatimonadota bacterium]|nr:hypothetical protein [Gemmatimonadota bacterium]
MHLTPDEQPVVRRAVAAYREVKKKEHGGQYQGATADEILDELNLSPARWTQLAAFVIETAEGPTQRKR